MKKILTLVLAAAAIFAASCNDDDPVIESVIVRTVGGKNSVIIGGEVPTVYAVLAPDRITNTSVSWFSSHPDVLAVDEVTGVLTLLQTADIPAPIRVIITAMSWNGVKGTVAITVQGEVAKYQIVDLPSLKLRVLDRNVGATAAYDKEKTAAENQNAVGNYYQWGRHVAVANGSTEKTTEIIEGWTADIEGNMGWNYPIQTPCPMGWTIPTREQLDKIMELAYTDTDIYNKLKLAPSGYFELNNENKWEDSHVFLWSASSEYDSSGKRQADCLKDYSTGYSVSIQPVYFAVPVRCVQVVK